jgi:hypothetical protein
VTEIPAELNLGQGLRPRVFFSLPEGFYSLLLRLCDLDSPVNPSLSNYAANVLYEHIIQKVEQGIIARPTDLDKSVETLNLLPREKIKLLRASNNG